MHVIWVRRSCNRESSSPNSLCGVDATLHDFNSLCDTSWGFPSTPGETGRCYFSKDFSIVSTSYTL